MKSYLLERDREYSWSYISKLQCNREAKIQESQKACWNWILTHKITTFLTG